MKKVLSELYSNNFDRLREKENRSLELEQEVKNYDFFKVKIDYKLYNIMVNYE